MCRVFGVSRSRYYVQLKAGASRRQREDRALLIAIKAAFDASDRTYGAGRMVRVPAFFANRGSGSARTASGG